MMTHRVHNPGKSIDNATACWRHIVQAWILVKPESIRHCFERVPLFGERHKAILSSVERPRDIELAVKAIQLQVDQVNIKRKLMEAKGPNNPEVQAAVDEDQPEVLSSADSLALWSAIANEEERVALQSSSRPLPVLPGIPDDPQRVGDLSENNAESSNSRQSWQLRHYME
ncbi:hypothetical protein B0O80DRAFT_491988 [Mortierella sp. GBAus27b]|nr:hypothetical protein B0O80DRAFT_491988 [Mortierella sp. GBAus27b]